MNAKVSFISEGLGGSQPGLKSLQPGPRIFKLGLRGLQPGLRDFQPGFKGLHSGLRDLQPGYRGLQPGLRCILLGLRPQASARHQGPAPVFMDMDWKL